MVLFDFILNHIFQLSLFLIATLYIFILWASNFYILNKFAFIFDKIDFISFLLIPFKKSLKEKYKKIKEDYEIIQKSEDFKDKLDKANKKIIDKILSPAIYLYEVSISGYVFYGLIYLTYSEDKTSISFNIASLMIPFILNKIKGEKNEK